MTTTTQPKKHLSVVTYLIALVCLLAGLLLPFCKDSNGDNAMLVLMIPSALGNLLGIEKLAEVGTAFAMSCDVDFFGIFTLDLNALAIVVYAVITVVGIIMLIPVFACKKKTPVSVCGYVVEVIAFIALFVYVFNTVGIYAFAYGTPEDFADAFPFDWPIIAVAFGGTFLMMVIQAIGNYKGSGVLKIVVWLLGAVGVFALLDVVAFAELFKSEYGSINGLFAAVEDEGISGFYIVSYFVQATFVEGGSYLFSISGLYDNTITTTLSISLSVAVLLAIVNFIIDTITLSAKTTKGGVVFDCVRYLLEVIAAVLGIVLLFVVSDYEAEPGILLYVLAAVAVICTIISIIRSAAYKKEKESAIACEPAQSYYADDTIEEEAAPAPAAYETPAPAAQPAAAAQPVYIPVYPVESAPAPAPAPAPAAYTAPAAQPEAQVVYKVKEVYSGPTDSFIARLNDSEKIEFAKLFIEKINGSYENVPDYVVGGDNDDFFAAIFIYLGKFRPILSDGLMNKIYNELNLLN